MLSLEELKYKRKSAIIIVLTLGLVGVSLMGGFGNIWRSNIFSGTSFDQGGIGFVCKVLSFLFMTILLAVPMFIIGLIQLIYYSIRIHSAKKSERRNMQHNARGVDRGRAEVVAVDIFSARYFIKQRDEVYGPLSIEDVMRCGLSPNTIISVNHPSNWMFAADIPDLMETYNYVNA